jgi:hypothetical protein
MAQLEHIEAIEKRLWSAADTLRANSNYASNEYFLPVMGLVFLRHAYSRYLGVKDAIEAGLPTRGDKARPLAKEGFSQKNVIFLQPRPDKLILNMFRIYVEPFLGQIRMLQTMNQQLSKARDLLLPKLMNGAVAVV